MANKNYNDSSAGTEKCSSKRDQILMSIVVCLPLFSYGAAMGWISPNKTLLMSNNSPSSLPFSEEEVSWMASIMFIFAPIAVFVYGAAADKFGRKYTSLCVSVPMALRRTVATIIMAIVLVCDFALLKIFAPLNVWISYYSTFWLFSFKCVENVFYIIFFAPETKMRKLEEIYADLKKKAVWRLPQR